MLQSLLGLLGIIALLAIAWAVSEAWRRCAGRVGQVLQLALAVLSGTLVSLPNAAWAGFLVG